MPSFYIKIQLRANEQYFRNFRCALGDRRQKNPYSDQDGIMMEMQKLCGEIENSLNSAQVKLSQLRVPDKDSTGRS